MAREEDRLLVGWPVLAVIVSRAVIYVAPHRCPFLPQSPRAVDAFPDPATVHTFTAPIFELPVVHSISYRRIVRRPSPRRSSSTSRPGKSATGSCPRNSSTSARRVRRWCCASGGRRLRAYVTSGGSCIIEYLGTEQLTLHYRTCTS